MNYREAINKINRLLGLQLFNSYKSKTGEELVVDGSLEVGSPIYSITENGQLPLSDGTYELEDETKIKVEKGDIQEIKYDMEKKQEMTEAVLKDGTVVKSPTFDVGENISVVSPDGQEAPAPDGEHEVMLKDSEGKEVLMKLITKDGKIQERENVELKPKEEKEVEVNMEDQMAPDLSEGNAGEEDFKTIILKKMDEIMGKLEKMGADYEDMKSKVKKFSKEPAGEPIRQPKNLGQDLNEYRKDLFSHLMEVRNTPSKKIK